VLVSGVVCRNVDVKTCWFQVSSAEREADVAVREARDVHEGDGAE